jgi:hypothetical protein
MIAFSWVIENFPQINFNMIVTNDSMREYLWYIIPEGRVPLDKKGHVKKDRSPSTQTIHERVLGKKAPS